MKFLLTITLMENFITLLFKFYNDGYAQLSNKLTQQQLTYSHLNPNSQQYFKPTILISFTYSISFDQINNHQMPSPSCKVYGLFISCIVSLALGIGTLVVNIVFKYIGFVDSDVVLGLCLETYLMEKYRFLLIQLQTAFLGICLNILMNCIVLALLIVTLKNLKPANLNPQLNTKILPQSVISKTKIVAIYILLSFGTLGSIVTFGYYLSLYFEALKDPSTCSFSYKDGNLLILMITAGVWLLGMIVEQIFTLVVNSCVSQEDVKQERQNKYKQMINVTQQPGIPNQYGYNTKPQDNVILKGGQFTEQPSNGELHSFGNQKPFMNKTYQSKQPENDKQQKNLEPFILKDMDSSQMFKPNNDTPKNLGGLGNEKGNMFGNFGDGNGKKKDRLKGANTNDMNPQRFYSRQIEQPQQKLISHGQMLPNNNFNTNTNQYNSGGSANKSPGKFYNSSINPNSLQNPFNEDDNIGSIRHKPFQNQQQYNNPFSKPLSPIKRLNESALDNHPSYSPSPIKDDPFRNVEMFTVPGKGQPQRILNTGNGRDRLDLQEQDIDGKLMFHMKAVEEENKQNRMPDLYQNDIQRFDKNSSGQVSFKSPSRFDSKFAQEQNKYLSKNTANSILPALNKIKESQGSRRNNGFNDNYSSGGINSYFAQSRGSNDSPGSKFSKTKAREGVLTSFIRGKFA